jgi:hypothetical protein
LVFPYADTILAKAPFGFGFGFEPPNFKRAAKPPCSAQLRPIAHNPKPKEAKLQKEANLLLVSLSAQPTTAQVGKPPEWLRTSILTMSA